MRFIDKIRDYKDEHKTEITICKIAGVVILGTALCCYCKGHMDGMDAYRRIVAANPDVLCKDLENVLYEEMLRIEAE